MDVGDEVAILYCGTHGLLHDVPLDNVSDFQDTFLQKMHANYQESVLDVLGQGKLTEDAEKTIKEVAAQVAEQYKSK